MTSILSDSAPAPPALPVSVVVCCDASSRWEQLVAACGSLGNQSHAAREIVLVVDHCQPLYLLAKEQLCGVEVIENHGLRGLAGARNTGVAASTGEVVAFLDDDAVADPDWIRELAAQYTDPRVLGVGGHVEPSWEDRRPSWFPEEFDWVVGCSHPGLPAQLGPVRTLLGANMSFRRTALADVGGFRHDVGLSVGRNAGGRDSKMSARAAAPVDSPVLQYQPAARVSHHVPAERGTWRYFCERCFAEGFSSAMKGPHAGSSGASTAARQNTPTAVAGGLLGAVVRARPPRAAAMLAGAGATTAGYLAGRAQQVVASQSVRTTVASFTVQLSPLALALVLWLLSLTSSVNLRAMSDLGLVSVLPTTYWAALALITISLPVLIHTRRAPSGVLIAYLVGLVLVLHATPAMLYESLRYAWGWKHVGMVDYILRHHAVDPQIGDEFAAYHSWSGFFALNAVFVKALGVSSSLSYASWGPPVFELLVLGPLRMLFTTLTRDGRQAWLALVIFYLGNWVAQDYFAPQAFGYFLYLVVLVMCLRWLSASGRHEAALPWWRRWLAPDHPGSVVVPPPQRKAVICAVVLLMVAIVTSHQLTPFMLLAALIALVIARHLVVAWLPWLLAALIAGWIYLMAMPFLDKNLYWIVESIGRPGDNTRTGFVDLSQATPQQELVSFAARGLTAGIGLLAVVGWLRLRHIGAPRRTAALLAASPVLLLGANSYGGEMLFRVISVRPAVPCGARSRNRLSPPPGSWRPGGPTRDPHRGTGGAVLPCVLRQGTDELLHPGGSGRLHLAVQERSHRFLPACGHCLLPLGIQPLRGL